MKKIIIILLSIIAIFAVGYQEAINIIEDYLGGKR